MSEQDDDGPVRIPLEVDPEFYKVGYKRPPLRHQGSLRGNRAILPVGHWGAKNRPVPLARNGLRRLILDEANRSIEIIEHKEVVSVIIAQAVVRKIGIDAMRGRPRQQELFMRLAVQAQREDDEMHAGHMEEVCKIKREWEEEKARRKRVGDTHSPDPLPHPDDFVFNPETGEVELHGPMTEEEEREYEKLRHMLLALQDLQASNDAELPPIEKPRETGAEPEAG